MQQVKICFVSPYAYSLFNTASGHIFGGSEVRAMLFGVGLSKLSMYEVSFVVFDYEQDHLEVYQRVSVYRHPHYTASTGRAPIRLGIMDSMRRLHARGVNLPVFGPFVSRLKHIGVRLRDLNHRLMLIIASRIGRRSGFITDTLMFMAQVDIYSEVDADIYCAFGTSVFVKQLSEFCKERHKKFVLFLGSDVDLEYHKGSNYVNKSIENADLIITQTYHQETLVKDLFNRKSQTIKNPIILEKNKIRPLPFRNRKVALWIGKSDEIKRPEILLELAKNFTTRHFIMIMNRVDHDIFDKIVATKPVNVEIIEHVRFDDMDKHFSEAMVMISTSAFEGFPNTFLQAGKYGVPILSLQVDPDGFIQRYACGIVACGDVDLCAAGLATISNNPELWGRFSHNIRRYVETHHDLNDKLAELRQALRFFHV